MIVLVKIVANASLNNNYIQNLSYFLYFHSNHTKYFIDNNISIEYCFIHQTASHKNDIEHLHIR
jgi:hypothetical protein